MRFLGVPVASVPAERLSGGEGLVRGCRVGCKLPLVGGGDGRRIELSHELFLNISNDR